MKTFHRLSFFLFTVLIISSAGLAQPVPGPNTIKNPARYFQGIDQRGVGLLDKGELSNLLTNYGIIADFHLGTPALHWPRSGTDVQHYGFGVDLILLAGDSVISSIYDPSSASLDFGWEAAEGNYFNPTRTPGNTAGDGLTPFLAFSDIRDTWPIEDGSAFWPGWYRENLDNPGYYVEGEFVSDRDVYGKIRDDKGMGLTVEQTAYSYGRPYGEDFIFVRFRLKNEGAVDYPQCYVGFQADLKADFYADDYIQSAAVLPYDTNPSFFYKWDGNGIAQRDDSSHFEEVWSGPVGYVGLGMVETPFDEGVTSFHYFHDDNSPIEDEYFTAIMTNDTSAILPNLDWYFHGTNPAYDDPALWQEIDLDGLPGTEITFITSSGPFDLAAGDSVDFAIVLALGTNESDLMENVQTAYFMAKERSFQGSGPPAVPKITAVPGDGLVKLFWDNAAEFSVDAISGQQDFEGYRIYKSIDQGMTWGEPITNYYGDDIGWVPLMQFDLIDSVTGLDPAYGPDFPNANKNLGDDTGILHSFTDYQVTNGIETWYCITAYDQGVFDLEEPSLTEPSYENAIAVSEYDANVAAVVPGTEASDYLPGVSEQIIEVNDLTADGTLEVVIVNPADLLEHTYEITFNDSGQWVQMETDCVQAQELTLNLYDLTALTFKFFNVLSADSFYYKNFPLRGDDFPIANGFRLNALNIETTGIRTMGWTTINGDSSTFDWWTENRHPGNSSSFEEVVEGLDDWRITYIDGMVQVPMLPAGFGEVPEDTIWAHLQVERKDYTSGLWVDATSHLWISDLFLFFPDPNIMGPLGWDLIPGGAGYNPSPNTGTIWPDMLLLRDDEVDSTGSLIWLKTQNGPASAIPPSVGDVFTIETYKPFNSQLVYQFSTEASGVNASDADLTQIKVVPNPLIVSSGLESNPYETKVMFTHLPSVCDITIYTVSGNQVRTLHHQSASGEGYTYWDCLNHQGQNVAYGLYVYVVKTPAGKKHSGKLMIIR